MLRTNRPGRLNNKPTLTKEYEMLIELLIALIIVGAVLYLLQLLPIDGTILRIIQVIVIVGVLIYVLRHLSALGLG